MRNKMTKFDFIPSDLQICVFCMEATSDYVCSGCNEYKGLMPFNAETEAYLDLDDLEEYAR